MSNEIRKQETAIAPKNITEEVQRKIAAMTQNQELFMPADYSPENALKSAWLKLQEAEDKNHNKALDVCTKPSIANALLDMVVQGLSPAKNQCYFVVYGRELTLMRSYMGTIAAAKRFSDVENVFANVIYEGDDFSFSIDPETGLRHITRHEQSFENIDITKIRGAYAVVVRKDAENYIEIMTMDQIRKAWAQGATKGGSPAHKNFTEEMAKKTVINRACKLFVNTSDDKPVLVDAFNRTTESDYGKTEKRYYDESSDVVIDVEDEELNAAATEAVFGEQKAHPEEPSAEMMASDPDEVFPEGCDAYEAEQR